MLSPLDTLDQHELLRVLKAQYSGLAGEALQFAPLGEDSWCYRNGDLWVSIRRDLRGHVPAAYRTAAMLHAAGLDFVIAPIPGNDGRFVRQVGTFPVVVFPYVPSLSPLSDSAPSECEIYCVIEMLSRVHESGIATDLPKEAYQLSFADDLEAAMAAPDCPPRDTGPYALRLRRLLSVQRQRIASLRAEYKELAAHCEASPEALVLTHGEPISSNIFRNGNRLLLADWGDAMWGPPERDWSHVIRTIGGAPPCRPEFRRLYDIRWILSEIAEYTSVFLNVHTGAADDHAMWTRLNRYLPEGW